MHLHWLHCISMHVKKNFQFNSIKHVSESTCHIYFFTLSSHYRNNTYQIMLWPNGQLLGTLPRFCCSLFSSEGWESKCSLGSARSSVLWIFCVLNLKLWCYNLSGLVPYEYNVIHVGNCFGIQLRAFNSCY